MASIFAICRDRAQIFLGAASLEGKALFAFDNSYARLPAHFYARLAPTPVSKPRLIRVNVGLAEQLGLDPDWLATDEGLGVLAGNRVPEGASPIAMAYAGHQFGGFSPQLGDGRAILLGEIVGRDGVRRDVQLKGSGPTPFSRRGDGRSALGPVLREYIVSEAMAALGIPTTRSLAAVITGDSVLRETVQPGGVLTRIALSHIRVGTFQYFAARGDSQAAELLANHVIARHYPQCAEATHPYRALVDAVIDAQASLVARWLHIGFIHGVMNTDNMSIAGETIDYGPCAFMDAFHPETVYSSIDHMGRYAYGNQPAMAQWNLARFVEAMLPLLGENEDEAVAWGTAAVERFAVPFVTAYQDGMRRKLGLMEPRADDLALVNDLLARMANSRADFTLTFRGLAEAVVSPAQDVTLRLLFEHPDDFDAWATAWRSRLASEGADPTSRRQIMRSVNPAFIPRNHRVEQAIAAAVERGDLAPFNELVDVLARPYDDQPQHAHYATPPRPEEVVEQTFCGT